MYVGADDAALASGATNPPIYHHMGLFHRAVRLVWNFADRDVIAVADGDRIGGFRAHLTPGHNPGHTVYVHDGLGLAVLGDIVWEDDGLLTTLSHFDVSAMAHGGPILSDGYGTLADLARRC